MFVLVRVKQERPGIRKLPENNRSKGADQSKLHRNKYVGQSWRGELASSTEKETWKPHNVAAVTSTKKCSIIISASITKKNRKMYIQDFQFHRNIRKHILQGFPRRHFFIGEMGGPTIWRYSIARTPDIRSKSLVTPQTPNSMVNALYREQSLYSTILDSQIPGLRTHTT